MSLYSNDHEDGADRLAEECEATHDTRQSDCEHCDVRATWQFCAYCGATYEDGKWELATELDGSLRSCHHEPTELLDDWGSPFRCEAIEQQYVDGKHKRGQCRDPVTRPGLTRCDFHQAIADRDLCHAELTR